MPLNIRWDTPENTCIYWDFQGKWDWEEFMRCDHEAYQWHMTNIDHMIYTIADMTHSAGIPHKGAINYFLKSVNNDVPNRALVAVVSPGRGLISAIEPIMRRLAPKTMRKYHLVQTIEEAYKLINQHRERDIN